MIFKTFFEKFKMEQQNKYGKITLFEKTRIIGARAEQLANNSKPLVEIGNLKDPILIALKEYNEGRIPIIIHRVYNGKEIEISFK